MSRIYLAIFFLIIITCTSLPAEAYLLPLIGVGGVIVTMLTGLFAALCAALFLVFYNVRRMLRKFLNKPDTENESQGTENLSDH